MYNVCTGVLHRNATDAPYCRQLVDQIADTYARNDDSVN